MRVKCLFHFELGSSDQVVVGIIYSIKFDSTGV